MTQLLLLPTCVLPGCARPTDAVGHPCGECVAIFDGQPGGWRLVRNADAEPMTEEAITERDDAVREQHRLQAEAAPVDDRPRKRNQLCWLCDQRRTCTQVQPRDVLGREWECDECLVIE